MRVCGVEIKGSEAILCLMELNEGLFSLPDCRQSRFQLVHDQDQEAFRKFQFSLAKLAQDYKIDSFVIRERAQKGKFAGSAIGFKIEAALQLIADVGVPHPRRGRCPLPTAAPLGAACHRGGH